MDDASVGGNGENLIPEQSRRPVIRFENNYGTYSALDGRGRRWLITAARAGWRLQFLDPGDRSPTYAGTHSTLRAAESEASRGDNS